MTSNIDVELEVLELDEKISHKNDLIVKLRAELAEMRDRRDSLKKIINQDNFKSMKWLIENPTEPGQYEAMQKLVNNLYGGEYNGVHPSGYTHDGEYNPIQQDFQLSYGEYGDHARDRNNIEHFMKNYLEYLKPVVDIHSRWNDKFPEMKVVPFQFSSKTSGLDYLGFNPDDKKWYHFNMVYGRVDTKEVFESLDQALDFVRDFDYHD